jgi:hypothetical protein
VGFPSALGYCGLRRGLFSWREASTLAVEQVRRWLCQPAVTPISPAAGETRRYFLSDVLCAVHVCIRHQPALVAGVEATLDETFDVDVVSEAEATVRDQTAAREGLSSWLFVDGANLEEPIEFASFTEETGDVSSASRPKAASDGGRRRTLAAVGRDAFPQTH